VLVVIEIVDVITAVIGLVEIVTAILLGLLLELNINICA
jgi:hypothetical protein